MKDPTSGLELHADGQARDERRHVHRLLVHTLGSLVGRRVRIEIQPSTRLALPDPAGLAIAEALDQAVHYSVCPQPGHSCEDCDRKHGCTYPQFDLRNERSGLPWLLRLQLPLHELDRRADGGQNSLDDRATPADGLLVEGGQSLFVDLLLFGELASRPHVVLRALLALSRVGLGDQGLASRVPFRVLRVLDCPFAGAATSICERTDSDQLSRIELPRRAESLLTAWGTGAPSTEAALHNTAPVGIELRTPIEIADECRSFGSLPDLVDRALDRFEALSRREKRSAPTLSPQARALLNRHAAEVPQRQNFVERCYQMRESAQSRSRRGLQGRRYRGRLSFGPEARAFLPLLRFAEIVGLGPNAELGRGEIRVHA